MASSFADTFPDSPNHRQYLPWRLTLQHLDMCSNAMSVQTHCTMQTHFISQIVNIVHIYSHYQVIMTILH